MAACAKLDRHTQENGALVETKRADKIVAVHSNKSSRVRDYEQKLSNFVVSMGDLPAIRTSRVRSVV